MSESGKVTNTFLQTEEIEKLVLSFESCTIAPAAFDHGAHLTVALWYLSQFSEADATGRMRAGLHRFTAHHNSQAYNETLTLFWLTLVRHFLDTADAMRSLPELANELLRLYPDSSLIYEYFSRPLTQTPEAKRAWVTPDLKPLDF